MVGVYNAAHVPSKGRAENTLYSLQHDIVILRVFSSFQIYVLHAPEDEILKIMSNDRTHFILDDVKSKMALQIPCSILNVDLCRAHTSTQQPSPTALSVPIITFHVQVSFLSKHS